MKHDTKFKPGTSGNDATKWQPGQSGNPTGRSKRRTQFEDAFNEALVTEGSPEEAAKLLWEAARNREPWALQEVCRRFAPETQSLRMICEVPNDTIDYSKLTDQQIQQLESIIEASCDHPVPSQSGESPTELL